MQQPASAAEPKHTDLTANADRIGFGLCPASFPLRPILSAYLGGVSGGISTAAFPDVQSDSRRVRVKFTLSTGQVSHAEGSLAH